MDTEAHITVSGRVQGVFFRMYTQREANSLNLKGWVRNLPNGNVEIVAQGQKEDIERLIKWCRKGPPLAQVNNVEVQWHTPTDKLEGFEIRY